MIRVGRVSDRNVDGGSPKRGFTLVEMAVVLVVLGLVAILVITLLPRLTERMRLDTAAVGLDDAREAVDGFMLNQDRLPCPDVNGDGLEGTAGVCDAGDEVGTVPFRSLGLPGPVIDEARLPLRYGVYRNAGASADLATLANLFEPTLPGALDINAGTVTSCGEVLENAIQIVYANDAESILTVTPTSGSFAVGDYVSGSTLDYGTVTPNTPTTYPTCPCGTTGATCDQCSDFVAGERIFLSGQSPDSTPNAEIHSTNGSRLILPFPTGQFSAGDTIEGEDSGVTAPVTDFYFPGTAEVVSIITPGQVFGVDLIPTDNVFFDPAQDFGFLPGHLLFSSGGDEATFVNLERDQQSLFQVGETVNGLTSGASGTIDADDGTIMTVSNVSGTFIGPPTNPTVDTTDPSNTSGAGETIQGATSGATADIVSITENAFADPVVTYGSLTIPDPNVTVSGQLNQLDMCKNLRNGALAASGSDEVHTVNAASVLINPAYLLVSGGVEDAIPGDVAFDGLNEGIATLDFNSPALGRNASYDDLVRAVSMQFLDHRLSCPKNLGAANAAAVGAMVAQNIAISSFNNHENALAAIEATWAGLKLAEASVAIEAFLVAIAAGECAKATTEAILTKGGSAAAAVAACAAAVLQAVNFAFAIDALNKAIDSYNSACSDQLGASSELFQAEAAAAAALSRALEVDQKEGVR